MSPESEAQLIAPESEMELTCSLSPQPPSKNAEASGSSRLVALAAPVAIAALPLMSIAAVPAIQRTRECVYCLPYQAETFRGVQVHTSPGKAWATSCAEAGDCLAH